MSEQTPVPSRPSDVPGRVEPEPTPDAPAASA